MNLFCMILCLVFALIGVMYLLRDGYRVWRCRSCPAPKCELVFRSCDFSDVLSVERAFLYLDALLSRPEAGYLIERVVISDVKPRRVKEFHDAAQKYDFSLVCRPDQSAYCAPSPDSSA